MALDADTLHRCLNDRVWRLSNLYKIITKGDGDGEGDGLVMTFKPNLAQRRFLRRLHNRNVILKARQLGFTTLITLLFLDTALFAKSPVRCGVIAHEREVAEMIFRDKVLFAYNHLPDELRAEFPLSKKNATTLEFGHNGASIRVATSMRGGTIHRLHVSELGKIAAKYPAKAREVMTGSIPAVPQSGILVVESTAEGQEGAFYDMAMRALELQEKGAPLTARDPMFHFFPWHDAPEYTVDAPGMAFGPADNLYFAEVRAKTGRELTHGQKAWYVLTRRNDFADDAPLMWQEYPSYPEEAFKVSTEGCYYAAQMSAARVQGRIMESVPIHPSPVYSFWDLGRGDMTAIWLMQRVGAHHRFIGYYEASGEDLSHFAQWLQDQAHSRRLVYGRHYLPHDAAHRRMGATPDTSRTMEDMLRGLMPGQRTEIVPRVSNITAGIQAVRNVFASCVWDETECKDGLHRLATYRKAWDKMRGCWRDEPMHDEASHGADAFRQFGQVVDAGETFGAGTLPLPPSPAGARQGWRKPQRGSAMAR